MADSDWDSVTVIRKRPTVARTTKSQSAVNQARRSGSVVAVEKKLTAGTNNKVTTDLNSAKIDREDEILEHKTVSADVGKAIQKARAELQLTQKDLAVKVNEKPNVIQEYEHGKAIPNQQILAKLERALGVKLRGKDVGQPLVRKGAASAAAKK